MHQRITGFGASSAWTAPTMTDADSDLLFTVDKGIGLTLLRVRIPPTGCVPPENCELETAQQAQARGATVWATPWSPPADWKSNNDVNDGGTLLPEHADDWAGALVSYVRWMKGQGVAIAYVSAQNEPTMSVSYESCRYTAASLADFIGSHLAPAFGAAGLDAKIIAPETVGWGDLPAFANGLLGNSAASGSVPVVATHSYGKSPPAAYPPIAQAGKELWQTEVYDPHSGRDPGIGSALRVAAMMHGALVNANVNAWHYWWIYPRGADNGALWDQLTMMPAKRLYAMGNFSRFVRPGFYRVEATAAPSPGISVSAYFEPQSGQLVIVAINANASPVSQRFLFDRVSPGPWTPWVTSADANLLAPADAGPSEDGADDAEIGLDATDDATTDAGATDAATDDAPTDATTGAGPTSEGATDDGVTDAGGGDADASFSDAIPSTAPSEFVISLEPQSITTLQAVILGPGAPVPADVSPAGGPAGAADDAASQSGGAGCACSTEGRRTPPHFVWGAILALAWAVGWRRHVARRPSD